MTVLEPPADLVMVVDNGNTAHVLRPEAERGPNTMTLCGGRHLDLYNLSDLLDLFSAPWSLLTDQRFRAWPPLPCQRCLARHQEQAA